MDVGVRIRNLRHQRGLEQIELAERIGISQSKMNKIESGFQKRIEPEILVSIAKVLGSTVDYLVGNSNDPKESDEEFQKFINDPELKRWYKELPKSKEEDIARLKKIWEAFKDD